MTNYGYTLITQGERSFVQLTSTDSQVMTWFAAEVRKFDPSCITQEFKLPSGEPYQVNVERLKDTSQIAIWIIRHLGQNGWEPFASDTGSRGRSVCLRLRYD